MSKGWYVTATNIVKWTENSPRQAQEILPLLVKRLIFASINPSIIRFPSGNSIVQSGWDGILKTDSGNAFIPIGDSAWELSTKKGVSTKSNADYSKRTDNPISINKKNSTFVFVTSRQWNKSNKWIAEKKSDGQWADIKVLTAEELEDWLELCPAVHLWFARLIGNRPDGAWDAEQAWNDWSLATKPQCTTNLVIAGRNRQSEELSQLLSSNPDIINVTSENKDEAYAFILATVKTYPWLLSRLLVVRDPKEWDLLVQNNHSLILVPTFEPLPTLGLAIEQGHWVLLPSLAQFNKDAQITLEKPNKDQRIKGLVDMGISAEEAENIVHDSKCKLHIIRRHNKLARVGQQKPDWANPENAEPLIAVLLSGAWLSDNTNDCEKVSYLASMPYDKLEQILNKYLRTGDFPAERLGNKWQIVSCLDSWQFLHPFITGSILNRFGEVAVDVLSESDPRFELPPTERWLAAIHKKVTKFSTCLRDGLSKGLVLLGSFGDKDCTNIVTDLIQEQVSFWVRRILVDDMSEIRWGSLAPELPMLVKPHPRYSYKLLKLVLRVKNPLLWPFL